MINISAWTIKKPIPSILFFVILSVVGLWAFTQLEADEEPNIDVPIISVTITQAGAAPSEVETQITRKVENALSGLANIKHITSTVSEGVSTTSVEFELGSNVDRALSDVRERVRGIRPTLPNDIPEPDVQRLDYAGEPFATYTISSTNMTPKQLSWMIENVITRSLLSVPGVGLVERLGGVNREIRVNLNPTKLDAVGLTAEEINSQIRYRNVDLPAGRGNLAGTEQAIRTKGSSQSVEELKALKIAIKNNESISLSELGSVDDSVSEIRQLAFLDGKPVIAFSVKRSRGKGTAQVAKLVEEKLDRMQRESLPDSVSIKKVRDSAVYIKESFNATIEALVLGAALAVVIIWFFLRDLRSAGISALAMPLSILPTFICIKMLNYTLNDMSLLGLALVIGILVDDAIVEIENIVRHIHMDKSPFEAALEAADEIGLAVVATTFSIIAVFVPLAVLTGITGQFFRQFGFTVAIAVFMSLAVARLMTPMMAAYWLKTPRKTSLSKLTTYYNQLLGWALTHRKTTIFGAMLFFCVSLVLCAFMPMNLMGAIDRGEIILSIELPPGKNLESTKALALKVNDRIMQNTNIDHVFADVGVNKTTLYVGLKDRRDRTVSQKQIEAQIRSLLVQIPAVHFKFINTSGIGGQLDYSIVGSEPEELNLFARELARQMRSIPGVADIKSNASLRSPELVISPNRELAAEHGITIESISRTAMVATMGDVDTNLGKFDLPDRQIYVRVQIDPDFKTDLETIKNLKVSSKHGDLVPLSTLATIAVTSGPAQISRYDKQRQILITGRLIDDKPLSEALEAIKNLPAYKKKPASVTEAPSGDIELQQEVLVGFAIAIISAVILMYCVLVLLFNDFIHPLTIMTSLPLSVGGAVLALMCAGQPLGLYALIGIVMLMGLVAKNAILLVEYCLMAMHKGMTVHDAIITAGDARMRPILMTTFAMVAGMIPIAIGFGAGAEARMPMAVAVVGGLTTSSILTLVVVPVIFSIFNDYREKLVSRKSARPAKDEQHRSALLSILGASLISSYTFCSPAQASSGGRQDTSIPAEKEDVETLLNGEYRKAEDALSSLLQPLPEILQEGISIKYPEPRFLLYIGHQKLPPIKLEAAYSRAITLTEALNQALFNNLPIKIAQDTFRANRALYVNALGGFLPDLSMTYQYQNIYQQRRRTSSFQTGNTVLSWAFFQSGKVSAHALNAYHTMKAAKNTNTAKVNDVLLEVYQKYNDILYNQALLQVRIKSLETSRANLKLAKQQLQAGTGTRFAVMQSESQLASDVQNLVTQQVTTRRATIALSVVLNKTIMENLLPAETRLGKDYLIDPAMKVTQLVSSARKFRPELKALEAQRRAAKAATIQAASALGPVAQLYVSPSTTKVSGSGQQSDAVGGSGVNLSTTGTGASSINIGGTPGSNLTLGTSITWNLGGLGVSDLANIEANRNYAVRVEHEYQQVLLDIDEQVHNSFLEMQTSEQQIEIADVNVNTSREGLRLASRRFTLGNGTNLELIQAQQTYVNALAQQIKAFVEFRNAQAKLLRDTGTISVTALTTKYN